jgi:hypothetical protein
MHYYFEIGVVQKLIRLISRVVLKKDKKLFSAFLFIQIYLKATRCLSFVVSF